MLKQPNYSLRSVLKPFVGEIFLVAASKKHSDDRLPGNRGLTLYTDVEALRFTATKCGRTAIPNLVAFDFDHMYLPDSVKAGDVVVPSFLVVEEYTRADGTTSYGFREMKGAGEFKEGLLRVILWQSRVLMIMLTDNQVGYFDYNGSLKKYTNLLDKYFELEVDAKDYLSVLREMKYQAHEKIYIEVMVGTIAAVCRQHNAYKASQVKARKKAKKAKRSKGFARLATA